MRYLKITRYDGLYDYVPLDNVEFHFNEIDDGEYQVELSIGGHHIVTIMKLCDRPDTFMTRMAVMSDFIIDFKELF